jgi:ABC-type fe3+-hydroxamate transport system, periplasmic component
MNTRLSRRDLLALTGLGAGAAALTSLAACGSSSKGPSSASGSAGASGAAPGTQTVTDMNGTAVEVPVNPTTYADGWYAHNEVTIMLTGARGLVATHCDPKRFPWMYRVCPAMSSATSTFGDGFNFEDLVALGPQVIFDSEETLRDKAAEVGIPLVNCNFQTYDEMKKSITLSAQVFGGNAPATAEKYNADLDEVLSAVKAQTDSLTDDARPAVMHGASVYTLTLDGTETIIDDWIKAAGGRNAVDQSTKGNAQAQFTLEQIIAWNPEVIITGEAGEPEQILADSAWASIKAVQDKKVYVNPRGVFGWDGYGVEEILQVPWAAHLLHPDLFPDFDISERTKDFYAEYLGYQLTDDDVELILAGEDPQ